MKDKKKKVTKSTKNTKKVVKKKVVKEPNYKSKHGKKRVRIRYGRLFIFFLIIFLLLYLFVTYIKIPIRNLYISGNSALTDQEIIDLSGLRDYPSVLSFTNYQVEKTLEKNILIKDAKVKKKFRKIYIEIEENYGLFYNNYTKKTIMYDGRTSSILDVLPSYMIVFLV